MTQKIILIIVSYHIYRGDFIEHLNVWFNGKNLIHLSPRLFIFLLVIWCTVGLGNLYTAAGNQCAIWLILFKAFATCPDEYRPCRFPNTFSCKGVLLVCPPVLQRDGWRWKRGGVIKICDFPFFFPFSKLGLLLKEGICSYGSIFPLKGWPYFTKVTKNEDGRFASESVHIYIKHTLHPLTKNTCAQTGLGRQQLPDVC